MDYNVEQNMAPDTIEMKMNLYKDSLVYIKADTTTSEYITLPQGIFQISVDHDELPKNIPAVFSCENILPVMISYPEYFMAEAG